MSGQNLQGSDNYIWSTSEFLGQGAFANVYRGRHKKSGELCAVKVFKCESRDTKVWKNELKILEKLKHRNIIEVKAIETELFTRSQVLIMELCNQSVWGLLSEPQYAKGFPDTEFCILLFDITNGIKYLREKKVSHRDIKPGNIMKVVDEYRRSIYKLSDFGSAKIFTGEETFTSLGGTEEYLHPQVYARAVMKRESNQPLTESVDIWSLGASLYHIATGGLPFKPTAGRADTSVMYAMMSKKKPGVISARQDSSGKIIYNKDLPETCLYPSSLKRILVPMFAGLMEQSADLTWNFDKLFAYVQNLDERQKFCVYDVIYATKRILYVERRSRLAEIQEMLAKETDVAARNQIIINESGICIQDYVSANDLFEYYPNYVKTMQFFMFSREEVDRMPSDIILDLPPIPNFNAKFHYKHDYELSQECAGLAYLVKNIVSQTIESQLLLSNSVLILRGYVKHMLSQSKELIHQHKRQIAVLNNAVRNLDHYGSHLLLFVQMADAELNEEIDKIRSNLEENLLACKNFESFTIITDGTLSNKVKDLERQLDPCPDLYDFSCAKAKCTGRLQHHLDAILKVGVRFRRDKNADVHTYNDEQIHKLERLNLKDGMSKVYSHYLDHCRQNLVQMHDMAYKRISLLCDIAQRNQDIAKNIHEFHFVFQEKEKEFLQIHSKQKIISEQICNGSIYLQRPQLNVESRIHQITKMYNSLCEKTEENTAYIKKLNERYQKMVSSSICPYL